jgi:hypothetical protein
MSKKPITVSVLGQKYTRTWAAWKAGKLDRPFDKPVSWIEEIIRPLAEELTKQAPDRDWSIIGPQGLAARVHVQFIRKGLTGYTRFEKDNCLSVTFEPGDLNKGEVLLVDYETYTEKFPKGTIGEINGFNFPTIACPDSPDEIFAHMIALNAKKAGTAKKRRVVA